MWENFKRLICFLVPLGSTRSCCPTKSQNQTKFIEIFGLV